ncbi:DUF4199 domain-containing protein [Sphingomonas sp.]|uniref:DUF4199 domain-containing protein n=1 Tax=Sphingomonas sp. TaxID=28214 RepID=UPI00286E7BEB|nr:DUF4199 domain-containing protein [Sphingomonas sp.]
MKYALTYGLLSGLVIIAVMLTGLTMTGQDNFFSSEWFRYLVMLVALTFIFVGVKRFRDVERGGVIKFGPALLMGLAIAAVAGLAYVVVWEIYLAATDYRFMDEYVTGILQAREAAGASPAELARKAAELNELRQSYGNPLFRVPMTFLEIFPVGLLVALVSAALLRNPKLLPAAR